MGIHMKHFEMEVKRISHEKNNCTYHDRGIGLTDSMWK